MTDTEWCYKRRARLERLSHLCLVLAVIGFLGGFWGGIWDLPISLTVVSWLLLPVGLVAALEIGLRAQK